ncbi:unnamed protein product, partial [Prunus brigantina]
SRFFPSAQNPPPPVVLFTELETATQPPPPTTPASETGSIRTATSSSLFPGQRSSGNRRISPELAREAPVLTGTSSRSISLNSQPFPTGEVLRSRIHSRRDPLRVKQHGTTSSS